MLSDQILQFFATFPQLNKYFLGVFSIDTVPKKIPINHFLVCNTDTSKGDGIHWFALFRPTKNNLECFDSLGVTFQKTEILRLINFSGVCKLKFNESQIQPDSSSLCGEFCIYFLFERLHNLDYKFNELVNELFSDNLEDNEKNVLCFLVDLKKGTFTN